MRFSAPASALDGALRLAVLAAAGRLSIVVRIVALRSSISFSVTNPLTAVTVTATCAANVAEPGSAIVAATRLDELIAGFPPNAIVTVATTDKHATVASGRSQYRLVLHLEAPIALAIEPETGRLELAAAELELLFSVSPAVDVAKSPRSYLTGVHLRSDGNGDVLESVATNGNILLRADIETDREFSADNTLIVPAPIVTMLGKLLRATKTEGLVLLRRSRVAFAASWPGVELVTSMIDGSFPDYRRVIPSPTGTDASVQRSELAAALARLSAVSLPASSLLALTWSDGGELNLCLPQQPGSGEDVLTGTCKGAAQVAVMLSQLAKLVDQFDNDVITLTAGDRGLLVRQAHKLAVATFCAWHFKDHAVAA